MASPGRPPRGPRPRGRERAVGISERAYRSLLRAYPRGLRDEYGGEMARCFRDLCRDELENRGGLGLAALWVLALPELLYTALKERSTMLVRNTYRSVVGVALAAAFILAWMDLAVSAIEEPDALGWMAPIGFFAVPVIGAVIAYIETRTHGTAYRAAVGVALAVALLLAWVNLAVGIIGSEDNLANLMYVGVLAVGIVGAVVARFRPHGMGRALFATALAQASVAAIALIFGFGSQWSPPVEILGVNGFFAVLWLISAWLFLKAAREQTPAGAEPEG